MNCDYCGKEAPLVTGEKIYPHRKDLYSLKFYECEPCEAYVGCHKPHPKHNPNGDRPLGRLATKMLRMYKSQAHSVFDKLWRDTEIFKSRSEAYKWLSGVMKKEQKDTHIGMFNEEECEQVINLATDKLNEYYTK